MTGLRHIGLVVKDVDISIDFYTRLLDFKIKKDQIEEGKYIDTFLGIKGVKVRTVKMTLENGGMLELLHFESHPGHNEAGYITRVGCSHIAFTVPDADSLYEKLKSENIRIINKPEVAPDGGAKVFFCKDHDGTWLELVEEL
tara:strand:+ start:375 stop:800 length:426 start_codon:yes stop_codon:yes gene_type:complete